jgi:hypothetical protein
MLHPFFAAFGADRGREIRRVQGDVWLRMCCFALSRMFTMGRVRGVVMTRMGTDGKEESPWIRANRDFDVVGGILGARS